MVVSVPTTLMAPAACNEMTLDSTQAIQAIDQNTGKPAKGILNSAAPGYLSSQNRVVILVKLNGQDVKKITAVNVATSNVEKIQIQVFTKYTPSAKVLYQVRYMSSVHMKSAQVLLSCFTD